MKDYADILERFTQHLAEGETFFNPTFDNCRQNEEFIAGDQWSDGAKSRARMDQSEMPVVNLIAQHFDQVSGEQRQQNISFSVIQDRMDTDKTVKAQISAHKSLMRSIAYHSKLDRHLSRAMEQCYHGVGWLHVYTEESADNPFNTGIRVQSLPNYDSAMLDPAFRTDWRDCEWGIVVEPVSESKYKAHYEEYSNASAPFGDHNESDSFITRYYLMEYISKTYYLMPDGSSVPLEKDEEGNELIPVDFVDKRTRKEPIVKMYLIIGNEVVKEVTSPFEFIPIIPLPGRERRDAGQLYYEGIIDRGKDPQRIVNTMLARCVEIVDMEPMVPWVGPSKAFEGGDRSKRWANANRIRYGYLDYNDQSPAAPQRAQGGSNINAVNTLMQQSVELINSTIGRYEPSMGADTNQSGVAQRQLVQQGQTSTFYYQDAQKQGLEYLGELICYAIPQVYDGPRTVSFVDARDQEKTGEINTTPENTITDIRGSVHVVLSKDWSTQSMELVEKLADIVKNYPDARGYLLPTLLKAIDAPEIGEDMEKISKALSPIDMLDDEERAEKEQQMANQPPPPEVQIQQLELQREQQQGQLEIEREQVRLQIEQTRLAVQQAKAQEEGAKAAQGQQQERANQEAQMEQQAIQQAMRLENG